MPRQNLTPNACNACKSRKIKCDGQQPCDKCALRKAACQYEARDARTKSELKAALNSLLSEREAGLSIIWDLVGHDQQRWEVIAARLQEDATAAGPSTSTSTSVARGRG